MNSHVTEEEIKMGNKLVKWMFNFTSSQGGHKY